uniref:Beta-Casp domain-containing protein n=1 Tax=Globisporangium ultimum (strain ATCC 200006 / CBS 805.95 / DAOM BR144) TaxID=431595 RepID=K3W6Y2_GLOUD
MSVTLERIGHGAAFVLHDSATATTLLLSCGEAKEPHELVSGTAAADVPGKATDDGTGDESAGSVDDSSSAAGVAGSGPLPRNVRRYARELQELMKREGDAALTAVLIPDYRPEACFMLPFLTEKSTFCTGANKEKTPLYDAADIPTAFQKTRAIALKACITVNDHLKITAFHSGHVAGGCAFYIEIGTTTVLYAPAFNLGGGRVLLPAQIPRLEPSAMITCSSFAVTVSETRTSMERDLVRVVHECVSSQGKVVIPVYHLGFFHELMAILLAYWRQMKLKIPIYVSDTAMTYPSRFTPLVRRTFAGEFQAALQQREDSATAYPQIDPFDWKRLTAPNHPFVLFTGPASIAHGDSCRAIKACATDPKNLIVLSEYCTPGTVNYSLYADPQRAEASKRLGITLSCGVHYFPCSDEVDAKSIVTLVTRVAPRHVLLDSVMPEDLEFVKTHVSNHVKANGDNASDDDSVCISAISATGDATQVYASRDIPLRIHRSMFSNPSDVQGLLIAEAKRKLLLVSTGTGARRLKKKRHALQFALSWKKEPEPTSSSLNQSSMRGGSKKKSAPSASALSFLLSAAVESADEDDEDNQNDLDDAPPPPPLANVKELIAALDTSFRKWLHDVPIERQDEDRWLKIRSVGVSASPEWEVHLEWSYEDEELAGRVLGLAKQVINAEYGRMQQQQQEQ